MKAFAALLPALSLLASSFANETNGREESISLFENRKVIIALPDGFEMSTGRGPAGVAAARITDRNEQISLQMTFLPDPHRRFANARMRKEFMFETNQEYVENSVEKAMQFEELDPEVGVGTYCVFTDVNLVGKATLPADEYLNATNGVKAWSGVAVVFTLLSNGTDSKEYQAAMAMLRNSVHERAVPLR